MQIDILKSAMYLDTMTIDFTEAAGSSDPATGLRAVAALRTLAEQLESLHVDRARRLGWSWAQIAAELGVSRQAAHQKHGGYSKRG